MNPDRWRDDVTNFQIYFSRDMFNCTEMFDKHTHIHICLIFDLKYIFNEVSSYLINHFFDWNTWILLNEWNISTIFLSCVFLIKSCLCSISVALSSVSTDLCVMCNDRFFLNGLPLLFIRDLIWRIRRVSGSFVFPIPLQLPVSHSRFSSISVWHI